MEGGRLHDARTEFGQLAGGALVLVVLHELGGALQGGRRAAQVVADDGKQPVLAGVGPFEFLLLHLQGGGAFPHFLLQPFHHHRILDREGDQLGERHEKLFVLGAEKIEVGAFGREHGDQFVVSPAGAGPTGFPRWAGRAAPRRGRWFAYRP
jgi:hypothetical protein